VDNPGDGVDIYILDSGINHLQEEFNDDDGNDRIFDLINVSTDKDYADSATGNGHGILIASALGAKSMAWLKVERFLTSNPKEMASRTCEEL
jgi:hypothetical protein